MTNLIKELREWYKLNHPDKVHGKSIRYQEFNEILSRHEGAKEAGGLESWENEAEAFYKASGYLRPGKDPGVIGDEGYIERRDRAWRVWSAGWCYRDENSPAPDKAVEPLAMLADRKGSWIEGWYKVGDMWRIRIESNNKDGSIVFRDDDPAAAEAKAREYLEGLEDK